MNIVTIAFHFTFPGFNKRQTLLSKVNKNSLEAD